MNHIFEKQIVEDIVVVNGVVNKHNRLEKTQQDDKVTVKGNINGMPIYKKFSNKPHKVRFNDAVYIEPIMFSNKIERMPTPYYLNKTNKKRKLKKSNKHAKSLRKHNSSQKEEIKRRK